MSGSVFQGRFWMAFDYVRNINVFVLLLAKSELVGSSTVYAYEVILIWIIYFYFVKALRKILMFHIAHAKYISK